MNLFETIKASVSTRQAAKAYGLEVDAHGMALCPFHDDHRPSLLLDQRYYCFGCHATGDVIDFAARLFGISQRNAALKLAQDFGIDPRPPTQSDIPILNAEPLPNPEQPCILSLAEEVQRLRYWGSAYAPKYLDDPYDARFVESCQELTNMEYLLECMIDDPERTLPIRKQFWERRNAA